MHEGKHGILDGVEDMDELYGIGHEHSHDHESRHTPHDRHSCEKKEQKPRGVLGKLFGKKES
ncbi:hypothetical protein LQE92_07290 [Lacrimispora sp. NSJ-141]|uniref:Uncharacterized protein n=1 Tax=Lientehia hominis TaxID=2897778 RepID=A0AAP2RID3_9FIRM|nr:hypothetical protein [Lientehia hominis]MCD2492436.1 hypothetical protein [Lientehia hominis]